MQLLLIIFYWLVIDDSTALKCFSWDNFQNIFLAPLKLKYLYTEKSRFFFVIYEF